MLRAHSLLWHYLWLGPHVLQIALAVLIVRRGMYKLFPIFLAYTIFEAVEEFTLYGMDSAPWVEAGTFWRAFTVGLVVEGVLRFAVIGEIFSQLLRSWPALARMGSLSVRAVGAILAVFAVFAAAYAPIDNPQYSFISRAHILQQTLYIVECGLILFVFLFAAHFKLAWGNRTFGIALGLGLVSCEHLAAWAVMASGALIDRRYLLDFLNMATYHVCVLIWCYYLLVPQRSATTSAVALPENNLELWNRELERLLQ
jgi:hypothetical protein